MKLYRARVVMPITAPIIEDGAVLVDRNRIVKVGRFSDLKDCSSLRVDLGACVLMPGLVNAHCHLDYTMMHGLIPPQRSFTAWIREINRLKRLYRKEDYSAAIQEGFKILVSHGTTSVANIESFPNILNDVETPPIRTWWFLEGLDIRPELSPDIATLLGYVKKYDGKIGTIGVSPHAPYTASPALYRAMAGLKLPLTTHVAESYEEEALFRNADGELYDLLRSFGKDRSAFGNTSPLRYLVEHDALPQGSLLVHVNTIDEKDIILLRKYHFPIVHCPSSHAFFGHPPFQMEMLLKAGVPVCLGTDSLASGGALNLFLEMQLIQKKYPCLAPKTILEMATINGAAAMGMRSAIGCLAEGAFADMIALPLEGSSDKTEESVLSFSETVPLVMVNGNQI